MLRDFDYSDYLSPFTDRYGSDEMRSIWSEQYKRKLWRQTWVALAEALHRSQLVTAEQLDDLRAHQEEIDLVRAGEVEAEVRHDVMAEIRVFAEQCTVGGGIIHLGATSADVEDNAEVLRIRDAFRLIIQRMRGLLALIAERVDEWAAVPTMGFTHLQPAEPTTIGYRFAQYGQDLLIDFQQLQLIYSQLRGKGLKGAVGTSASFMDLLEEEKVSSFSRPATDGAERVAKLEAAFTHSLGLESFPITTQIYPRKQDWLVLNSLAGIAGSLYKLAFDLRILQSPGFGEWFEPAGKKQVSSSAMPFKRNPVGAETINSLGRLVAQLPRISWDNAAHSLLERTLDDMANRREILPLAFLALDEMLERATAILTSLHIDLGAVRKNLLKFEAMASTERLLLACVKGGGDRQELHEVLREHIANMSDKINGHQPLLIEQLAVDKRITAYIAPSRLAAVLNLSDYAGDASSKAKAFAAHIRSFLGIECQITAAVGFTPLVSTQIE